MSKLKSMLAALREHYTPAERVDGILALMRHERQQAQCGRRVPESDVPVLFQEQLDPVQQQRMQDYDRCVEEVQHGRGPRSRYHMDYSPDE